MNSKAKELNMTNTSFSNPIGMDDNNNYSTAFDLSKLLIYSLKNEKFKKIFSTNEYTTTNNLKLTKTTYKTAKIYNIDISDITYTGGAGYCLASTASIDGVDYLMVTLGAVDIAHHLIDSTNIYNYYRENYSYKSILNKGQKLKTLKIKFGKKKTYDIISDKSIKKYLKNDIDLGKLEYVYDGIDTLTYKIKKGDYLGKVTIKYNDEVLDTYKVYLNDKIEYIIHWFIIIPLSLISIIFLIFKIKKKRG